MSRALGACCELLHVAGRPCSAHQRCMYAPSSWASARHAVRCTYVRLASCLASNSADTCLLNPSDVRYARFISCCLHRTAATSVRASSRIQLRSRPRSALGSAPATAAPLRAELHSAAPATALRYAATAGAHVRQLYASCQQHAQHDAHASRGRCCRCYFCFCPVSGICNYYTLASQHAAAAKYGGSITHQGAQEGGARHQASASKSIRHARQQPGSGY